MDLEERKAQILAAQHLTLPAPQETTAQDLCGFQAQFLTAALHNLTLRTASPAVPEALVKTWTLRGTVHLISPADLPLFLHRGRTPFLRDVDRMVPDGFVTLARKQYFAQVILAALAAGTRTRAELKAACQAAGMTPRESESIFDPWGGLLRCLAEEGKIVHTVSHQKAFRLSPPFTPMEEQSARTELLRRYFTHYGPATVKDAAYFFALPQREIRALTARLPLEHTVVDGKDCFSLPSRGAAPPPIPPCLLLGHFDPLMLGYEKSESIFLPPEHLRGIFSRAGIVMAPVLLHGRVSGRWKHQNGVLTLTPFTSWSAADRRLVLSEAEARWPIRKTVWQEL